MTGKIPPCGRGQRRALCVVRSTVSVLFSRFHSSISCNANRMTASQALKHKWIQTQVEGADEIERQINVLRASGRKETFRKYLAMKKLKKAALSEIANHLTKEEVGALGEIFHTIDTDKNGVMSLQELDDAISHGEFIVSLCFGMYPAIPPPYFILMNVSCAFHHQETSLQR